MSNVTTTSNPTTDIWTAIIPVILIQICQLVLQVISHVKNSSCKNGDCTINMDDSKKDIENSK